MKNLILIFSAAALLLGCSKNNSENIHSSESPEHSVINVSTFKVEDKAFDTFYMAEGVVEAKYPVQIASKITAKVAESFIQTGVKVVKGSLLLKLAAEELLANFDSAKSMRDRLEREYSREARLLSEGAAASETVKNIAAELKVANAKLREAETMKQYLQVRSPIDGIVLSKNIEAGDLAVAGKVLCEIADTSKIRISVNVPLSAANNITKNSKIRITVLGRNYFAEFAEMSPKIDTKSNTQNFKFDVLPPLDGLKLGETVTAHIPTSKSMCLAIPLSCVSRFGQIDRVFTVSNGKAVMRIVKLGMKMGNEMVIVKAGLENGDVLIENPSAEIKEGSLVK